MDNKINLEQHQIDGTWIRFEVLPSHTDHALAALYISTDKTKQNGKEWKGINEKKTKKVERNYEEWYVHSSKDYKYTTQKCKYATHVPSSPNSPLSLFLYASK